MENRTNNNTGSSNFSDNQVVKDDNINSNSNSNQVNEINSNSNQVNEVNSTSNQSSIDKINNRIRIAPREFIKGLLTFLKEYSVIGLAIGLIIGQASKDLVDAIVNGLFMPLIQLIISKNNIEDISFKIRDVNFELGKVISSFLVFIIVMTLLYFIIKKIIKNDKLLEKK